MNEPTRPLFKGCDIRTLGPEDVVQLSRCWQEDKVRMTHRIDGKADVSLKCRSDDCACARVLSVSLDQLAVR